jgi:NADH-quinone oxidoreductase subunit N
VLVLVGLAFKIGAFPAHSWVPDVAQGSPAPAAAFLTVAPKIGGLVALARLLSVVPVGAFDWRPVAAVASALTMTIGNLSALWQQDLRRLLGWSSVSQAGYALMAIATLGQSDDAARALVYFVAAYAVAQMTAFAVVVELRGRTAIDDYRGLATRRPWLAAALTVALLSFVGIPPTAGFAGKLLLFSAAIDGGYSWLAAVAVANTVVSLVYYLRVIVPMDLGETTRTVAVLGTWSAVAVAIAGALVLVLGIGAQPVLDAMGAARLLP